MGIGLICLDTCKGLLFISSDCVSPMESTDGCNKNDFNTPAVCLTLYSGLGNSELVES